MRGIYEEIFGKISLKFDERTAIGDAHKIGRRRDVMFTTVMLMITYNMHI